MTELAKTEQAATEPAGRVLVIGGYGVFGGRLCRLLAREDKLTLLVAGRSRAKAEAFCREFGGRPTFFDREGDLAAQLATLEPDVVIDAAGPFQCYGQAYEATAAGDAYRLARAALEAGAHYLDLADDAAFVAGIGALDDLARQRGKTALSGVSTVPAISSTVAQRLTAPLKDINLIESAILPGNRAPRGLSVVRAILSQAGRPVAQWRGNRLVQLPGWGGLTRRGLTAEGAEPVTKRWASLIGLPDPLLFPRHFGAKSVISRAGLEHPLMHLGLWLLAVLPRWKLLPNLAFMARPLIWVAERLKNQGSDRGGMYVTVRGYDAEERGWEQRWDLIVEAGEGPFVPALPGWILTRKLLRGEQEAGARPCLNAFNSRELEAALTVLPASTAIRRRPCLALFEQALGPEYKTLKPAVRALHRVQESANYEGRASVEIGQSLFARLCRLVMGFPPSSADTPVRVNVARHGQAEVWTRRFGKHRFHSRLSLPKDEAPGAVIERFGPLTFRLALPVRDGELGMEMAEACLLGIKLPRWLLPISDTTESMDAQGRFTFSVDVSLAPFGRLVHYRGWLTPVAPPEVTEETTAESISPAAQ